MRILTAEEVSKEIHDITTREWPMKTMLFMKNLYRDNPPNIGVLIRTNNVIESKVRVVNNGEGEFIPYASLKAMVEDGWVVD